jgi:hypothetical protein
VPRLGLQPCGGRQWHTAHISRAPFSLIPPAKKKTEPPKSAGEVVLENESVKITKFKSWSDAYYEGVMKMVPPGREFKLDDTLPDLSPTPEPPKASSPSPAPAPKKAEKPKRTSVSVKTFDSWQAAFLEGYGFPAAGQKVPKKPEPVVNATDAAAANTTTANATVAAAGNETATATTTKKSSGGARRLMMPGVLAGVVREALE